MDQPENLSRAAYVGEQVIERAWNFYFAAMGTMALIEAAQPGRTEELALIGVSGFFLLDGLNNIVRHWIVPTAEGET